MCVCFKLKLELFLVLSLKTLFRFVAAEIGIRHFCKHCENFSNIFAQSRT